VPATVTPILPVTGQSPSTIYVAGDVLAAAALDAALASYGATLAGAQVTFCNASTCTTVTWAATSSTGGGVSVNAGSSSTDYTLGILGDTFTNRFVLRVRFGVPPLVSVAINCAPASALFDTNLAPKAAGSSTGRTFVVQSLSGGGGVKALYSHKARIGGDSNEDQYACLAILFETPLVNGRMEFSADTDRLAAGSTLEFDSGTISGYLSAAGPLGDFRAVGTYAYVARASAAGPLGLAGVRGFHDFSAQVADLAPRYSLKLTTPDGTVTIPISSWQAALKTGGNNQVQAVVPACAPYVAQIAAATLFEVYRVGSYQGGEIAYQMASAPPGQVRFSQSPTSQVAFISGFSPAFADAGLPDSLDRTLADVRSVFVEPSGTRLRCAVDWLLRPGMRAVYGDVTFDVGAVTYFVADGDQYMDVRQVAAG
jgi:hypothetical protein